MLTLLLDTKREELIDAEFQMLWDYAHKKWEVPKFYFSDATSLQEDRSLHYM
jgi:hypothetical protein